MDAWDEVGLVLGFCCAMTVKARAKQVIKGRVQQMKQLEGPRGLKVQSRHNGDAVVVLQWVPASGKVHPGVGSVAVSAAARGVACDTRRSIPASQQASCQVGILRPPPNPHIQYKTQERIMSSFPPTLPPVEMGSDGFNSDTFASSTTTNGNGHVLNEAPPALTASTSNPVAPPAPGPEKAPPPVNPNIAKAVDDVLYSDVRRHSLSIFEQALTPL